MDFMAYALAYFRSLYFENMTKRIEKRKEKNKHKLVVIYDRY